MLGLVCHFIEEKKKKNGDIVLYNKFDQKVLQLGRFKNGKYTDDMIKEVYLHNLQKTLDVLPEVVKSGIRLFRLSSNLLPLCDIVSHDCWDNDEVKAIFKKIGLFITMHNMRVCVHPGQFCVLSSDSDSVVEKAFIELATHGWMFDAMGLDHSTKYAINIHGGKSDRSSRLIEQIKSLPDNVRKRLTLENDETCYSLIDLLEVHKETGVPITWDSHHHVFNDAGLTMDEAMSAASETWPAGIRPLQHISNTDPALVGGSLSDRRKHSDYIHYVPSAQLQALRDDTVDVEVEAKQKNFSVMKLAKDFSIPI
ncbi:MAG: UV DNA damage repair endonuclease UvsE [Caulobacteraceae bacterium]|nr:UV DNA damage repair endonuclease UvsE [Caulobacteraceae bacterium]